jgi:hypothetical protein
VEVFFFFFFFPPFPSFGELQGFQVRSGCGTKRVQDIFPHLSRDSLSVPGSELCVHYTHRPHLPNSLYRCHPGQAGHRQAELPVPNPGREEQTQ